MAQLSDTAYDSLIRYGDYEVEDNERQCNKGQPGEVT